MKKLNIGGLVAEVPIVQGGMGVGISLSGLAAAVARTGAIGVIAAAGIGILRADALRDFPGANLRALRGEIRQAKSTTDGIIGVNIMVAMSDFPALATAAMEEGADIIFSGAGLPLDLPRLRPRDNRTRLVPIVSSARAFRIIATRWLERHRYAPDAVVVEGPLAGGHLGFRPEQIGDRQYSLDRLVPAVVEEARRFETLSGRSIPVIAAGGIYTGHDIYRFTQLGAAGVQMATRFVGTFECDAAPRFKQAYLDAGKDDIAIIQSPVGMPGRALRNRFTEAAAAGERRPFHCPYRCISTCDPDTRPYCIAMALKNAREGKMEDGFAFAGANAYRVNEIVSVRELVSEISAEYACSEAGAKRAESRLAV